MLTILAVALPAVAAIMLAYLLGRRRREAPLIDDATRVRLESARASREMYDLDVETFTAMAEAVGRRHH